MATSPVPMFDPNGTVRMIPPDQANAALQAGGKPAVKMLDPEGTPRWIPQDQRDAALQAGGKLADQPPAAPAAPDDTGYSLSAIMNRVGHSPSEFVHNVGQRLADVNTGIGKHIDRSMLTIEKAAQALGVNSDTLRAQIAHDEGVVNAPEPASGDRAGNMQLGDDAAALIEYMGMHQAVKGLGLMDKLEQLGPVAKVFKANPNMANVLRSVVENGVTGGTQAGVQGGDAGDVAGAAILSGVAGGAAETPRAIQARAGDIATEVQPTVKTILNRDYTVLPSEARDPNGLPLATPLQTKAANIANEPELRAERQQTFKATQQDLAKTFMQNALTDLNQGRAPDLPRPTDIITSDGQRISPAEARASVEELQHWIDDPDVGVRAKTALQQQHADLTDQLSRFDNYAASQPHFGAPDVADHVDNTNSFGDASAHLKSMAVQKFNALDPETNDAFRDLRSEANRYQSQFDNGNEATKQEAMANLDDVNQRIQDLFAQPEVANKISGTEAEQGFKEYRLGQAAKAMQNLFNRHMSYSPSEAAEGGGRTNVSKNMNSFTTDLRNVEQKYGSVLKPYMGDDAFSGMRDIGELLNTKVGKDQAKTILSNAAVALKRHLSGIRGVTAGAGFGTLLAHSALTGGAGSIAGLTYLTTEGAYRMMLNRMATDPAFAQRVVYAAKNGVAPRIAGPLLAATVANSFRDNTQPAPQPQGGQQ